tara:strand:+ start:116 stop:928 length:813 start_codon:yes stop_codon:yes gene_type:complete
MAKKPTITTVASGFLSRDQVNTNFTVIRDAFDNTLSLDGSTPNTISSNIDFSGYDILNLNGLSSVGGGVVDLADLATLGAISADISSCAPIAADITAVSGISADVVIASANSANISYFANTYRISATEPNTSLDSGDLYWNTTTSDLWIYNGSAWDNAIGIDGTNGTDGAAIVLSTTITGNVNLDNTYLNGNQFYEVSAAAAITIPPGLTGTEPVTIQQTCVSSDEVSFVAGAGVTLQSIGANLILTEQYATVTIVPKGSDVYALIGALK